MKRIRQAREKAARNAEYAALYPRRDRAEKKRDRRRRTIARERRWLEQMNLTREKSVPLA